MKCMKEKCNGYNIGYDNHCEKHSDISGCNRKVLETIQLTKTQAEKKLSELISTKVEIV